MRPAARMPMLTRRSRILIGVGGLRPGVGVVRAAADRHLRQLAVVRRTRLPLGVHHRAGHPDHPVPGGGVADRRHPVRRDGPGLPHPPGVRADQRAQRPGRPVPDRGDDPAAAGRHRGGARTDRVVRRAVRGRAVGDGAALPARQQLRDQRPAVRQGSRLLRVRPAVLPAGAELPVRRDVPGVHREPVGPLPVRRHPVVRSRRRAQPRRPHPADHPGRCPDAAQGRRLLAGPLRAAQPHARR